MDRIVTKSSGAARLDLELFSLPSHLDFIECNRIWIVSRRQMNEKQSGGSDPRLK
jgi:hypothetical protein